VRPRACVLLLVASVAAGACSRGSSGGTSGTPPATAAPSSAVAPDVTLPSSRATALVPANPLVVVLSPSRLALGRDGPPLAVPDVDPAAWSRGFEGRYKQGSQNDMRLLPLEAALADRHGGGIALPPVLVEADAGMPYRMLFEVLFTLGQGGVSRIALEVSAPAGLRAIELETPSVRSLPAFPAGPAAAVALVAEGFVVRAAHRHVGVGCDPAGAEAAPGTPAVPTRDGAYDFAGLAACVGRLRASSGEAPAVLVPMPDTDVRTLVAVIDAPHRGRRALHGRAARRPAVTRALTVRRTDIIL
jgi:hypothetical protein